MFQVPPVDRHKLLLYLEAHNLSIRDFLSVIKGEKLPRFVSMWKISLQIKERITDCMFQGFHSIPQRRDEGDSCPIGQRLKVKRWELLLNWTWIAGQALFKKELPFNIFQINQIKKLFCLGKTFLLVILRAVSFKPFLFSWICSILVLVSRQRIWFPKDGAEFLFC